MPVESGSDLWIAMTGWHRIWFERVEECLYFYYQHEQSTVHVVSMEKCRDRMRAMEILREECRARGCLETYAGEIAYKAYELGCRNTLFSYL